MHTRKIVLDAKPTEEQSMIFTNKPAFLYLKYLWAYCWSLLLFVTITYYWHITRVKATLYSMSTDEDFSMFFNFHSTHSTNKYHPVHVYFPFTHTTINAVHILRVLNCWCRTKSFSVGMKAIYMHTMSQTQFVATWLDMSNNLAN